MTSIKNFFFNKKAKSLYRGAKPPSKLHLEFYLVKYVYDSTWSRSLYCPLFYKTIVLTVHNMCDLFGPWRLFMVPCNSHSYH